MKPEITLSAKGKLPRVSWLRHLASLLLMIMLDVHQRARRFMSRTFLRFTAGLLSLGLLGMTFTSLYALRSITESVESLISDSMVGLESSVAMRAVVRESQIDLLRLQLASDRGLARADVDAFQQRMTGFLRNYKSGIFDAEDAINAGRIDSHLAAYLAALERVMAETKRGDAILKEADESARDLVNTVENSYQFNRRRVHANADEAKAAAGRALIISNRLWWSFAGFAAVIVLIYLAYRWLALPEGNDG